MTSDALYLIGFFAYFGLEQNKPDINFLFDALRSIQNNETELDISYFRDDALHLVNGMNDEVVGTIQAFLSDKEMMHIDFMNGWRVAQSLDFSWNGGPKSTH